MSEEPSPQQIETALRDHPRLSLGPLPGRKNHLHGAVVLPLVYRPQLHCVATVRAKHMRHHAGEVCFPGGMPEAQDANLRATALREAKEEIAMRDARVLGELSNIPLYTSDHRIFPFVAHVPPQRFVPNHDEVAQVLELPVTQLLSRPYLDGLSWQHRDMSGMAPVFEIDGALMYGATAHALYELLGVVGGLMGRTAPPLQPGRFSWSDVLPKNFVPPSASAP